MPIRKRNKDDFMSREMDERLSEMEASISNVYEQAVEETTARLNSYMEQYEEENRVMRARLLEGEITDAEYEEWARRNLLRTQQYSTTIDSLTEMLVNADTAAIALVSGELPYVIAESYNFTQFVGHIIADHEDIPNVSFEIYNAQSVQAIIRDNPQILPVVDPELDTEWNRTRLNREITQGIIQGNTIPQLATRLQRVTQMDRNSAIRAARTSMTGAENMGRNESHRQITSQGIDMVKRWSATYDARTRDTHRLLDNTTANEKGLFGEGILDKLGEPLMEFPGDPKGAAAEIYNCRCRLNIVPPDYSREANAQAYERWMQENYPADYRALNEDNYFDRLHKTDEWTAEAQRRVDRRIERLREAEGQHPTTFDVPPEVQARLDKWEQKYYTGKSEHSMLVGEDGSIIYESKSSKRDNAPFAPSYSFAESLPPNTYSIHNHPATEMFSVPDIANYVKYGTHGIITTPNGEEHFLFNLNSPMWRQYQEEGIASGGLAGAWGQAINEIGDNWLTERRAYIDTLQGLERAEQRRLLSIWDKENSRFEMQCRWLEEHAQEYGFIYRRRRIT